VAVAQDDGPFVFGAVAGATAGERIERRRATTALDGGVFETAEHCTATVRETGTGELAAASCGRRGSGASQPSWLGLSLDHLTNACDEKG
jgi:hypothetical protein